MTTTNAPTTPPSWLDLDNACPADLRVEMNSVADGFTALVDQVETLGRRAEVATERYDTEVQVDVDLSTEGLLGIKASDGAANLIAILSGHQRMMDAALALAGHAVHASAWTGCSPNTDEEDIETP